MVQVMVTVSTGASVVGQWRWGMAVNVEEFGEVFGDGLGGDHSLSRVQFMALLAVAAMWGRVREECTAAHGVSGYSVQWCRQSAVVVEQGTMGAGAQSVQQRPPGGAGAQSAQQRPPGGAGSADLGQAALLEWARWAPEVGPYIGPAIDETFGYESSYAYRP
ncbi:hypothetical protein V6N13_044688 [Hibiscus sabdariffa]